MKCSSPFQGRAIAYSLRPQSDLVPLPLAGGGRGGPVGRKPQPCVNSTMMINKKMPENFCLIRVFCMDGKIKRFLFVVTYGKRNR
jgi:hypothetical protein